LWSAGLPSVVRRDSGANCCNGVKLEVGIGLLLHCLTDTPKQLAYLLPHNVCYIQLVSRRQKRLPQALDSGVEYPLI
jgi:hypothetical protein